ncbi:MAG: TIGR04372 family glycosyltransferase [Holosporaceae bacterium]|nr:TIGR04372 family glycosyltransferase [Holosporaceae bacterium]
MDMTVLNALGEDDNVIILAHPRILNVSKFFCANVTLLDIWKQTAVISPFLYIPFVFASFYWKDHMKYSTLHFASISPLRSDWKGFFPKWNENDIARAKSEFERMKIDPCIPHICFMARDNAYKAFGDATPQTMSVWEIRNTPVSLYYKSMEMLAEKGYTVFRMGSLTNEIVQLENERIIDYANLYRTEFMDLYLASTCRFFVSCGTGVDILPIVSGLPVVLVNAMYIAMLYENWNLNNIYLLPRKTYDPMEKRFISLCEMYTRGIANQRYTTKIQRIQNTPEEIWKIVREVEERLSGTWEETDEDIKLQERYRSIMRFYEGYQADFEVKYRIGADFLRENADWFLTMLYHLASFEEHQQFEKGISTGQLKIATYGMTETNIKFLPEGMLNVGNVAVNFDGNPEKWGEIDVLGLKIQPPEKIKEYMVNLDAMLIMSSQYFRISEILEKLGVEKYYIRVGFESNTDKRDYLPVLPEKFRIVMYDQKLYKPSPYLPPFTGNEWELSQIHMNSGAYVINGE